MSEIEPLTLEEIAALRADMSKRHEYLHRSVYAEGMRPFEAMDFEDEVGRVLYALDCLAKAERDFAAGRLAGLREAAEVVRGCQTFDWKGGEEWAAGYVDGKNAAADAIDTLATSKDTP